MASRSDGGLPHPLSNKLRQFEVVHSRALLQHAGNGGSLGWIQRQLEAGSYRLHVYITEVAQPGHAEADCLGLLELLDVLTTMCPTRIDVEAGRMDVVVTQKRSLNRTGT